jgi:antitoxin component YwqK of YwqJK toxin-antitoxin module
MRKLFIILLLVLLVGCNQTSRRIIDKYSSGQTRTENIYPNKRDTLTYNSNVYYESGKLKHKVEVVSGKFVGEKITYYENGKIQRIEKLTHPTALDDAKYDCQITNYRSDGTKESDYKYQKDKINGLATDFDSTGKIARTTEYVDGKINGLSTIYYPSGKIWKLAHCRNDSAYGYEYEFDENGDTLRANISYGFSDNGVFAKKWLADGRIVTSSFGDIDRNFVIWKWYNKKGVLLKTFVDKGTRVDSVTKKFSGPK